MHCLLKPCSINFLHCLVKIHSLCIINCWIGVYIFSAIYSHVHGHDIYWNGSNQNILLCICWKSLSQVVSGASPCLDSFCVFVSNGRLYLWLLIWCGFLHWCFLGIIFLHWWYFCLFLWFCVILTGSKTFIWWRNKFRWWIMLLRMHKRQFIYFYKPTHGLSVSGWNKISITTIDSGEVRIKWNM